MYANYSAASPPVARFETRSGCKLRKDCRLCGSYNLSAVLQLTPTPPANAFIEQACDDEQEAFPLVVYFCDDCTHLQLLYIVDPEILFRHYVYVSGTSPVMRNHLRQYAADAVELCKLSTEDLVLEFGSNDGTLLRAFKERGFRIVGVDPAKNLATQATASGILTIPDFFNVQTATKIVNEYGKAKLVCANHCCAHIDDFVGVISAVKTVLHEDGVWIFEVGYLLDVYKDCLFDTIYHEHVDFHAVLPLVGCFTRHGLKLLHVCRSSIQGGALRCHVGWAETAPQIGDGESINQLIHAEAAVGLHKRDTYLNWDREIKRTGIEVATLLRGLKSTGVRIVGYGAPAKATTLMYHFGLTKDEVEYIVDDNELKQGLLSPGLHIPIVSPTCIYTDRPDYVIVLAWNFADSIVEQHSQFLKLGGRFIVPLPHLRVIRA